VIAASSAVKKLAPTPSAKALVPPTKKKGA
jgi:hypothetical protein